MNKGFIGTGLLIAVFVSGIIGGVIGAFTQRETNKLGATILQTQLTDTIGTFRTNVNSSLNNLNDQLTATTSSDPGHKHSSSSILGPGNFTTSSIGNASSGDMSVSGFLGVAGTSTLARIVATTASTTNITASGFVQGAKGNFTDALLGNPLPVGSGGTLNTTFTKGVVTASGTEAFSTVAPGTTGNILSSDGTSWVSSSTFAGTFTSSSVPNLSFARSTSTLGTTTTTAGIVYQNLSGASTTLVVGANRRVQAVLVGQFSGSQSMEHFLTLTIDGLAVNGAGSVCSVETDNEIVDMDLPMTCFWVTDRLASGSHTFAWQVKVDAGTATIRRIHATFVEIYN